MFFFVLKIIDKQILGYICFRLIKNFEFNTFVKKLENVEFV